jgi:hypothetical protein
MTRLAKETGAVHTFMVCARFRRVQRSSTLPSLHQRAVRERVDHPDELPAHVESLYIGMRVKPVFQGMEPHLQPSSICPGCRSETAADSLRRASPSDAQRPGGRRGITDSCGYADVGSNPAGPLGDTALQVFVWGGVPLAPLPR